MAVEWLDARSAYVFASLMRGAHLNGTGEQDVHPLLREAYRSVSAASVSGRIAALDTALAAYGLTGPEIDAVHGRVLQADTDQPKPGTEAIFTELGADELDGMEFAPVYWPVPGVLPEGATIFAAPPKSGKSSTMLGLAAALTTGGRALGRIKVERVRVLYFSLEESPRLTQRRLWKMLGRGNLPADLRLVYAKGAPPLADLPRLIEQYCARFPATKVVVIDTVAHARGSSPRARKDIAQEEYQELAPFSALAQQLHIAIVLVSHTRKGEALDEMEMVSGSFGISGAVDNILLLARKRHEPDATLAVFSRELDGEQKYALVWDALLGSYTIEGTVADVQSSKEQQEVLELLEASSRVVSTHQVATALGLSDAAASARLRRYVDAGIIASAGYGKYAARNGATGVEVLKSGVNRGVEVGSDVEVGLEVTAYPPLDFNGKFNAKSEFNRSFTPDFNTSTPDVSFSDPDDTGYGVDGTEPL